MIDGLKLPVKNVLPASVNTDFYAPGSILGRRDQARQLRSRSGFTATVPAIWFENGPAFEITDPSAATAVATLSRDGKPAAVRVAARRHKLNGKAALGRREARQGSRRAVSASARSIAASRWRRSVDLGLAQVSRSKTGPLLILLDRPFDRFGKHSPLEAVVASVANSRSHLVGDEALGRILDAERNEGHLPGVAASRGATAPNRRASPGSIGANAGSRSRRPCAAPPPRASRGAAPGSRQTNPRCAPVLRGRHAERLSRVRSFAISLPRRPLHLRFRVPVR